MQLTLHTDYALRVLIYLTLHPERLVTIDELAGYFNISKNHLVKIVHKLGLMGYLQTLRGKGGGMRLARPAKDINIGEVVRMIEGRFYIAECFDPQKQGQCAVQPMCGLTLLFTQAVQQFMHVLDEATLAQMVKQQAADSRPPPAKLESEKPSKR